MILLDPKSSDSKTVEPEEDEEDIKESGRDGEEEVEDPLERDNNEEDIQESVKDEEEGGHEEVKG